VSARKASTHDGAAPFVPDSTSLRTLSRAAAECQGCDLYRPAIQTVFGAGPKSSRLMLVGEQPGDVEDKRGKPFVGPAGGVLARALDAADIDRDSCYLTNAVKHFSFVERGKRRIHQTPRAGEITACRPWVVAELAAVRPRLTVCLGSVAARSLLGPGVRVLRDRGVVRDEDETAHGPFLVTIHPSAVLRASREDRSKTFDGLVHDLRVAAEFVE
jgi:uracil-DNA glycosylase family protein